MGWVAIINPKGFEIFRTAVHIWITCAAQAMPKYHQKIVAERTAARDLDKPMIPSGWYTC